MKSSVNNEFGFRLCRDTSYNYMLDPDDPTQQTYITQTDTRDFVEESIVRTSIIQAPSDIIKGNRIFPNPWSYRKILSYTPMGQSFVKTKDSDRITRIFSGVAPYAGRSLGVSASVNGDTIYNECVEKLYEKLRGNLDLSITAFQAKSTAALVSPTAQLLAFSSKARLAKNIGSAWLQYQYGWRPLVNDIYSAIDESLKSLETKIENIRARKSIKETDQDQYFLQKNPGGIEYVSEKASQELKYQIGVRYSMPGGPRLDRWTSLNPASIAWELLPYSFVVDWVYNVGGYLRSAESAVLYSDNFVSGYISTLLISRVDKKWISTYNDPVNDSSYENTTGSSVIEFNRSVLATTPFPRPPQIDINLGSGRLLNAAALLSQHLKRG